MMRIVLVTVVLGVTLASGLIHGKLSNRFGHPASRVEAAEKLAALPKTKLGDWELKSEEELKPRVRRILECTGSHQRTYVNSVTGEVVRVAIIVGPPQPTTTHTPEICYSSRNFKVHKKRKKATLMTENGTENALWRTIFKSRQFDNEKFAVYYGWTTGKEWLAEEKSARFKYAWHPYLYKLQVSSNPSPSLDDAKTDPCKEFLTLFLPLLQQHLQPQD